MRDLVSGGRRSWGLPLALAAVFGLALALRYGHLLGLQQGWAGMHLFDLARSDAAHHWREAETILDVDPWLGDRIPWKGPGYSYFLAGLIALLGRSPGAVRWSLALLGAVNCAGLVLLARRVLSLRWSVAAGGLAACNGVLIFFDAELLFPTLLVTLNGAALLLLTRERRRWPATLLAGLLLGLAALVHAVYLLPAACMVVAMARRRAGLAAVFALGVVLAVAPVSLQNRFARGQPVPISWNGGVNVYAGNQPAFDQYSGNGTNAWVRIMQTPLDAGIEEEYRRDRLYYRLAWRQLRDAPGEALVIAATKLLVLLSPVEYASNVRIYELRRFSPVLAATLGRIGALWWPSGIWIPAALLGVVLAIRRPDRLDALLLPWSAGLALSIVLSFNTARYRAPLVFFGCIWVARAVRAAWEAWRAGRHRRLAGGLGAFVVLAGGLAVTAVPQRAFPPPLEWVEASYLAARGAEAEAETWIRRALHRHPRDPALRLAVSGIFRKWGRLEEQRRHLEHMLAMPELEPDLRSLAHEALAESHLAERNTERAREELLAALAVGVDETVWRGEPYFQMGLGPVTACWLRLQLAEVELMDRRVDRARELVVRVREDCAEAGRLAPKLVELERRIDLAALTRP